MRPMPTGEVLKQIRRGVVIPASPLALTHERKLDERRQRALFRYYAEAGAGGVAVAVHTTQFEIRDPEIGLFEPVLRLGADELQQAEQRRGVPLVKVAGVCGPTSQALGEAQLAAELGYDVVLLSVAALKNASVDELHKHCSAVAEVMPLFGFYLQPAVGGRILPYEFWRRFSEIDNVVGIKIAPFNRYQTLDVVRGVADAGRAEDLTLYTGNDDNIVGDLVTPFAVVSKKNEAMTVRIRGGLLGQFSVWTSAAVRLLDEIHQVVQSGTAIPQDLLARGQQLTDANAVVFDAAHNFAGCIPGINEVLRRQGLLANNLCLREDEVLSPGQSDELDRVSQSYPWLIDDDFVAKRLKDWLG